MQKNFVEMVHRKGDISRFLSKMYFWPSHNKNSAKISVLSVFLKTLQHSPCGRYRRHCPSLAIYPEIPYFTLTSCSLEVRHPFEGDKLDEPDTDTECGCCFSLAMPSYNNTIMLFIPAAWPDTPTPSQPEALGRRHAVASNWPGCVRQRVFDRGWVDRTERVC